LPSQVPPIPPFSPFPHVKIRIVSALGILDGLTSLLPIGFFMSFVVWRFPTGAIWPPAGIFKLMNAIILANNYAKKKKGAITHKTDCGRIGF
jgi:hypothetical protein